MKDAQRRSVARPARALSPPIATFGDCVRSELVRYGRLVSSRGFGGMVRSARLPPRRAVRLLSRWLRGTRRRSLRRPAPFALEGRLRLRHSHARRVNRRTLSLSRRTSRAGSRSRSSFPRRNADRSRRGLRNCGRANASAASIAERAAHRHSGPGHAVAGPRGRSRLAVDDLLERKRAPLPLGLFAGLFEHRFRCGLRFQ